jgi:hypothetical protein
MLKLKSSLLLLLVIGCLGAGCLRTNPKPPVYFPPPRPAIKVQNLCELDHEWCVWFGAFLESSIRNCTTLMVLRGEVHDECEIK